MKNAPSSFSVGACFRYAMSVLLVLVGLLVAPLVVLLVSPLIVWMLARKQARAGRIILGVYTMSIAILLIYAQIEKISVSGHVFRWLKGEGGIRQDMNDLADDAKKVVNPSELQQWAVIILHETQPTNTEREIPADKLPANIRTLSSDEVPDAEYEGEGILAPGPCIMLYWGGPMGHWGLCVGSQTFKIQSMRNADYIGWKPGVYFWCETR